MKVEDIRINHKYIDVSGTIHVPKIINSICKTPYIIDENSEIVLVDKLSPYKELPYIETSEYGQTSLCIDVEQGTFISNIDTKEEGGYNALYTSFRPAGMEGQYPVGFDLFALRDDPKEKESEKDVRVLVWSDIFSEDPIDATVFRSDVEAM